MDVPRTQTEGYKVALAAAAFFLVALWPWLKRKGLAKRALITLTIVSCMNYARWGFESTFERVDSYDLIHYYLNSKYFDELGYYDLYPCIILADKEADGWFQDPGPVYMAQDAEGHQPKPIAHAVVHGRAVRAERFTPERWDAFAHDALHLQREIKPGFPGNARLWREMIQDHGFNGTPAWLLLAEPLANAVPVESIKLLAYVDLALMAAGIALVGWAFGSTTAWWTVLWLAITYSMRWPYLPWVFLRYDWVFALMATTAFLKKGHPLVAGLLAGWATTLRFFPAMWMWGPFSKGVGGLVRKKVHRQLLVMAGGFVVAAMVVESAAIVRVGTEQVEVHFENMIDHNSPDQLSSRRIGLALALTHPLTEKPPNLLTRERRKTIGEQKPLRFGLGLILMVAMGWGMRRLRDEEAFAFGFLPFFLLTTASYYYYTARVTLAILHASDLSKLRNRVGLGLLMAMEVFCNWAAYTQGKNRMFLIGWLASALCVYAVVMCVWILWEARAAEQAEA
jgi:hypothetical protein